MNKDVFKTLIIEGQEELQEVELYERPFEFEEEGRYVLVGIRQAGKSYLLYQLARQLMQQGYSVKEAAMESGRRRMRPIFLTTCTTALGVLPMILSKDALWMPMGVVICFGSLLSIILIVEIMPVCYWLIFRNDTAQRNQMKRFPATASCPDAAMALSTSLSSTAKADVESNAISKTKRRQTVILRCFMVIILLILITDWPERFRPLKRIAAGTMHS